jgi:membrane fusion protein, copper/silver efflux system
MKPLTSLAPRRWIASLVFASLLVLGAFVFRQQLFTWFGGKDRAAPSPKSSAPGSSANADGMAATSGTPAAAEIDHYTCSMHPSVKQQSPGKCPICGMTLIPVTKQQQAQGVVLIDEARRQLIGVKTGTVAEAPMNRSTRAVGRVAYDESTLTDVTLKVGGFITKLVANKTGQRVTAGQTLFLLYSPELYNAQQDFLLSTHGATAAATDGAASHQDSFNRAARQRLHLLGLREGQIVALEKKGAPSENIAIASPASGFVIEKDVVEGASVEAGMRLFRIAALNKVWVEAELYEADLAHVRVGQSATVSLDYLPGQAYEAKVAYVYPYVDATARTGRVRLELANKELELRPGMYASVELASATESRLQVPAAAVVYTGPRRLVFVDLGEGRFRPQEVQLGSEVNGMYEVLSGLNAGDSVATSGVFLIAAEARISTAAKYWDKAAGDAPPPGAMPPEPASAPPVHSAPPRRSPPKAPQAVIYTCLMHPEVQSPTPGQCPKCGMTLVPKPSGAAE